MANWKYEYGIEPTETFDRIYLRSGSHDSTVPGNYNNYQAGVYVRQRFSQDCQLEMGNIAPHGRFVNVFVNGTYYGMHHMHERPTQGFMEEYTGGDADQYDAIRQGFPSSGTINQYNEMVSNANNYAVLKNYMNEQSFIDYIQIMFHSATHDYGTNKNWRASGPSELDTPLGAKWHFFCWDMDTGLGWYREPAVSSVPTNNVSVGISPGNMYAYLKNDIEFKFDFADRLHCNFYEDGPMTKENMTVRFNTRIDEIKNAALAEHLRWTNLSTYTNKWHYNVDLTREFINLREGNLLSVLKADNMYPDLSAVNFSKAEGEMNANENLTLTNSNSTGTIYYTTNGEDPKLSNGSVNPNALVYNNTLSFNPSVIEVFARVYDPTQTNAIDKWSAACPKTFYIGQNYEDVIINEIHYNPKDSIFFNNDPLVNAMDTIDGKNFEFVELKNIGNQPVNLFNCQFSKGINLAFEESLIIEPDSFLVFAEDAFWFEQKYGFAPDVKFSGKLDNGGEKINLKDPFGIFMDTLRYDDGGLWDNVPDEGEYSLAYFVNASNNNDPANWAAQNVFVSPRAENEFCIPISNNATVADISCNGADDGFIATQLNGGTAPFSYSWDNGAITSIINNLSTGNYSVTITDFYNCPYTESFTITEAAQLSANITSSNQTYYQTNDGSASVINVYGGIPPYSYSWSNGITTAAINNLAPGNYTVDITDANGCLFSESVVIDSIFCNVLIADVTILNETCLGANDGLLILNNTSNGTSPYSKLWSNGITGTVVNNLSPGNYNLTITDIQGCPFEESYTINAATEISITPLISNASSNNVNDGSIDLMVTGGTSPYSYYWSNSVFTEDVSGLAVGSYWVSVTDANDCQVSLTNLTIDTNCPLTIVQQNNPIITSQVYQVGQFIQSNGMVNINEQVAFKAGDYIELVDDFEVIQGADFEAIIEGCQ